MSEWVSGNENGYFKLQLGNVQSVGTLPGRS